MATIDKFIPVVLRWEAGITIKDNETLEQAFNRAKVKGFSNDPADPGGATMVGVTINTYKTYCKRNGMHVPTVNDLKAITYTVWRDILHTMYWNKWKADLIEDQTVANMLVDWVWGSGASIGIKRPQKLLKVVQDGIVGPKTIAAVNNTPDFLKALYEARKAHFEAIVKAKPTSKKFLKGWMNRLNYIYTSYEK